MEESIGNHSVAISRIEDLEDDMKICKVDIDQRKIHGASVDRDIRMFEASLGNAFEQLERVENRVDGCYAETRRVCSLSKTNTRSMGLEIQRVQQESRKEIQGLFFKFERVNQIFDKQAVRMEEKLEQTVSLVEEKINSKIGEITADWVEALEIEEARRKDLEEKVAFLEEKITNCLLHQADTVNLVLALQGRLAQVEDVVMEESEDEAEVPSSSSSSDLDPVENMVVIPVPAPSVVHTLVEIPEEFVPPILRSTPSIASTPSPEYVQALEEDPASYGVPEFWADPEA